LAILSCAIFAIKAVYSRWHFNLYNDDKKVLGKGIAIVAHKAMIEVMMGVTLCFIPFEDDFDRYLKILVSVIVGYLIFIPLSRKWIFN
jgi:glycosylphosphatidylinositol transamidase